MAGRDRMTIEEVVRQVLRDEHADVIRESVRAVGQEIMEAEVSELIGAEHGERRPGDRATHRNGYRARRWDTRAGEIELQIPKIRQGSYFPSILQPRKRSEQALVSVVQQAYVCGVSTRRVDQLVESLGLRISKSEVSRIAGLLDEQVQAFRERPLEGRYPYLFVDAKVEKVRDGGRVARKCVVIAHAVHETGRREIIGLAVGEAETEAFWREFLRSLVARGLAGVQLAISEATRARTSTTRWARSSARSSPPPTATKPAAASGMPSANSSAGCRRSPRCSRKPKTTCSRSSRSRPSTGPSCARRTRWSASTARSAGAPTSSGSSPTTPR
jgi:putative transposase